MGGHPGSRTALDVFDGAGYSTAELRAIALDGRPGLDPCLALLLLAERSYAERVADLARVLRDEHAPRRLRVIAATGLGRIATPPAAEALRAATGTSDPIVLRSVASALGRTADPAALPDLRRLAATEGIVGRVAADAETLVRIRSGIDDGSLPVGHRLLPPAAGATVTLQVRAAATPTIGAVVRDLDAGTPGLRLSAERGLAFTCDESQLVVLLTSDGHSGDAADRMRARRMVLAVVAEQLSLEDEAWEMHGLVVSEPAGAGRAHVALVTLGGRPTMDGEATLEGGRAQVTLTRVEAPGAVPVRVEATIDAGRLSIERLDVGTERHPPLRPTRLKARAS